MESTKLTDPPPENKEPSEPFSIDDKPIRSMTDTELQDHMVHFAGVCNTAIKQHLQLLNNLGLWTSVRAALDYEIDRRAKAILIARTN